MLLLLELEKEFKRNERAEICLKILLRAGVEVLTLELDVQ
jgi:hypothetical protein